MLENDNPCNMHPGTFASLEALLAHFTPFKGFFAVLPCGTQKWDVWVERAGAYGIKRPVVLATYCIR
jgi:hypothetical protein